MSIDALPATTPVSSTFPQNPHDLVTPMKVFDTIRTINDPEHPQTLQQLNVVQLGLIKVNKKVITLTFTPTIPHCSMATLIGLCIRVKLERFLPGFKFDVSVTPGTHVQDTQLSKQLNDKERVSAALENPTLMDIVERCIEEQYIDQPVFNANATCGNTLQSTPEEHDHDHNGGECCGGHGSSSSNTDQSDNNQDSGCCGGHGSSSSSGGDTTSECCQSK